MEVIFTLNRHIRRVQSKTIRQVFYLAGIAAAIKLASVAYIAALNLRSFLRRILTELVKLLSTRPTRKPSLVRSAFREAEKGRQQSFSGHSHPIAAAKRTVAEGLISNFAQTLALRVYSYQQSSRDQNLYVSGCRDFYWSKDTLQVPRSDVIGDMVVKLVDVDYYVDMHSFLCSIPLQPVVLYTINPQAVYEPLCDNVSFTFDQDSKLTCTVSGGGCYVHQLWNWNVDVLTVVDYWRLSARDYLVERRLIAKHREVVCLVPIASYFGLGAFLHSFLTSTLLTRLQVNVGAYSVLRVQTERSNTVSIARVGDFVGVTVDASIVDALRIAAENSAVKLTTSAALSYSDALDKPSAIVLVDYILRTGGRQNTVIYPANESFCRYQIGKNFDPEAKNPLKAFMNPIVLGAHSPDTTVDNHKAAVEQRVVIPQREAEKLLENSDTQRITNLMDEFVNQLKPEFVEPVDFDEVMKRQDRPAQRHILWESQLVCKISNFINSFIKVESYDDIKPPRIISTIKPLPKCEYSSYIYPISEAIKDCHWYAFGCTPLEIANRVAKLCSGAMTVVTSDMSKFDGHVSYLMRKLEWMVLARFYKPHHHAKLRELHQLMYNQRATTRLGVEYKTLASRLSGAPDTSLFNSVLNAFVAYVCLRNSGSNPDEAYASLGLYGGDDGLTPDISTDDFVKAAVSCGFVAKSQCVNRGSLGVHFLARYYSPNVWYGCPDSMCDLRRQLSKFHTSANLPPSVTSEQKLLEKCTSFHLTDANTPVLGDLCRKTIDLATKFGVKRNDLAAPLRYYWSNFDRDVQFPNTYGDWMLDVLKAQIPDFDMRLFKHHLNSRVGMLHDILVFPLCSNFQHDHVFVFQDAAVEKKAQEVRRRVAVKPEKRPLSLKNKMVKPVKPTETKERFRKLDTDIKTTIEPLKKFMERENKRSQPKAKTLPKKQSPRSPKEQKSQPKGKETKDRRTQRSQSWAVPRSVEEQKTTPKGKEPIEADRRTKRSQSWAVKQQSK